MSRNRIIQTTKKVHSTQNTLPWTNFSARKRKYSSNSSNTVVFRNSQAKVHEFHNFMIDMNHSLEHKLMKIRNISLFILWQKKLRKLFVQKLNFSHLHFFRLFFCTYTHTHCKWFNAQNSSSCALSRSSAKLAKFFRSISIFVM